MNNTILLNSFSCRAKSCKFHSISNVPTHCDVVSIVVGGDCSSNIRVDVNTVNEDMICILDEDVPRRGRVVDVIELLDKLLCLRPESLAECDVHTKS